METFMFNPPKARGRRAGRRASRRARRAARKARTVSSASGTAWKILVKKYGVRGAMKHRASMNPGRSVKMARGKRARKARRAGKRAHRARRAGRKARRSRARKNPVFVPSFNPGRKHRRRRARKNPFTSRRARKAARKAWHVKPGRRSMLRKSRRNIRKALNKRFGARKWRKHSRARWNPALSVSGLTSSVQSVFSMESLYDGVAIAAGVVGALALPGLVQRVLPASISGKVNLTSGWTGYLANAVSAGLLGWAASAAINPNVGRKVLLGGLGATVARIALERIPGLAGKTGVAVSSMAGMGASPELSNLIAQEVASEMQSRGAMGAYLTPSQVVSAEQLGDYATPNQVAQADSLGLYDATGEF